MRLTAKQSELAARVASSLIAARHPPGHRITEEQLTSQFGVSRSPVRAVMQFLASTGFLAQAERGYFVPEKLPELEPDSAIIPKSADQELHERIARDRARDQLPEQFSEAEFIRRYEVPRSQLIRVLNRLALDGVVEPSAGHGWRFLPTLNSQAIYRDSYRFRMMIEPQGLLEPTFVADKRLLQQMREDQVNLAASLDARRMFEFNAALHETLAGFSNNFFIVEAVRRHSRLRRLNEQLAIDKVRAYERISEHVAIIDALLNDQREWAASLLKRHLDIASQVPPPYADPSD
jgi:DNA-binding GntR family transcriptional regulator